MSRPARATQDGRRTRRLRIASYAVQGCRGPDGRVRPARVVEVLRELSADVVALQEVRCASSPGPQDDQARFLADELGLEMQFGSVPRLGGGEHGNLVLSALPLGPGCRYDLSAGGREARGCLRAEVRLGESVLLYVFVVHLGASRSERRRQGTRVLEAVVSECARLPGPSVVLGDFDEWAHAAALRLLGAHFESVDVRAQLRRTRGFPGLVPFLHAGRLFHDPGLQLRKLALHRSPAALAASHQLPLLAEFELPLRTRHAAFEACLAAHGRLLRDEPREGSEHEGAHGKLPARRR